MGLYDRIRCEYPLPLPAEQGELAGKNWSRYLFQTKDLGKGMGTYCIRQNGELWYVGAYRHRDDRDEFLESFIGTITFYSLFYRQRNDYWVEWLATFTKGKLTDLRLSQWRLKDNAERLRIEAKLFAEFEQTDPFLETRIGRLLYSPYAWLIGIIISPIAGAASAASGVFQRAATFFWRLNSLLTPHGDPLGARRRSRKCDALAEKLEDEGW